MRLKIGELASLTQCPAQTIRYYEREGLLAKPMRTVGNYRVYLRSHVERLSFIRNCRSLDMTLEEIRDLLQVQELPQENCEAAHRLLDEHIAHVASRVAELQQLEKQLKALRRRCKPTGRGSHCGILDDLGRSEMAKPSSGSGRHVRGAHRG